MRFPVWNRFYFEKRRVYMKHIERILNAKTIPGLKRALNDFWFEFMSRESDDILLLLQEELEKKTDSGIHRWLYSYLPPCNDGEEFMDTLITFEVDCDAFYNVNKDITVQITEKEFMEVVEEFNRHCDLKNLLSEVYNLNIIETDRGILSQENCYLIVDKTLNIFLPRVTKETNVRKYVGEFLGLLIYELEVQRAGANRTSRNLRNSSKKIRQSRLTTQELYRICFYDVFLVEEITEERFVPKREIGKVANHFDVIIANIVDNSSNE